MLRYLCISLIFIFFLLLVFSYILMRYRGHACYGMHAYCMSAFCVSDLFYTCPCASLQEMYLVWSSTNKDGRTKAGDKYLIIFTNITRDREYTKITCIHRQASSKYPRHHSSQTIPQIYLGIHKCFRLITSFYLTELMPPPHAPNHSFPSVLLPPD